MPGGGAMSTTKIDTALVVFLAFFLGGVAGSIYGRFSTLLNTLPPPAQSKAPDPPAAAHFEEVRKDAPTLKDLREGQCSGVFKLERLSDGKVYVWAKYAIETEPSFWLRIRVCREGSAYVAVPLNAHALIVEQDIAPSKDYIPVTLKGEVR